MTIPMVDMYCVLLFYVILFFFGSLSDSEWVCLYDIQ